MDTACEQKIEKRLLSLAEPDYRAFQCKLMPTVPPERVLGVRTPHLRALAKEFSGSSTAEKFLHALPHRYYEENNLHAFLIERIRDYDSCIAALEEFLPYVDNWATCDSMSPAVFKKHLPQLRKQIDGWLASSHTYTVRFGIGMLMGHFLDDAFSLRDAEQVAAIRSEEYYVNMMIAWYFATALAKQYDAVLPFVRFHRLPEWVHRKTIQKAVESFRITPEQKELLKSFR